MPLTGKPSRDACAQFQDQWIPKGNQRLRVRRYATASHTPASVVLMNVNTGETLGFFKWTAANGTEVRATPSQARFARVNVCNG